MNVSLTPQLEELISKKVETGFYRSASEVVREALRLLEEHDRVRAMRLDELRRDISLGIKDLDEGRSSTFDDITLDRIKANGRKMLADRSRQGNA